MVDHGLCKDQVTIQSAKAVYCQETGDAIRITIQELRYDILQYPQARRYVAVFLSILGKQYEELTTLKS